MTTPASLLNPEAFLSPLAIDQAVRRALDEDLGRAGDITSIATIPEATHARAILIARQAGALSRWRRRRRRRACADHLRTGARGAYG